MKKTIGRVSLHLLLLLFAFAMIYPILWLVFASFKDNQEIFGSINLLPKSYSLGPFIKGWSASAQVPFSRFYWNSIRLVATVVSFTLISSGLVGYGFARFSFPGRKIFFTLMLSSLMIPATVLVLPRFILFRRIGWIDTYLPFTIPALMANHSFFIYMFVQFFRGIPREYDESAFLDGCGSLSIYLKIILPLSKPAFASAAIFQFIWSWNDFFGPLIYLNKVRNFTVSLGLKMTLDVNSSFVNWNQTIAMAVLALIPNMLIYFIAQKQFVEGVTSTGLKG